MDLDDFAVAFGSDADRDGGRRLRIDECRPTPEFRARQRLDCLSRPGQFSFPFSPPTLSLPAPSNAMATAVKK